MSRGVIFSEAEAEFLKGQRVARIATVDPSDGYPHIVPICYVFDGISFYTTSPRGSKRLRNIKHGSSVSVLIDKYEERIGEWLTLQGLLIKCEVALLDYHKNTELFMKGWRMLIEKYPQYRQWANEDLSPKNPDKRTITQMRPIRKTSWGFTP
ncbi:MAG: pyridoxamine 5'-phosphate oxidase family protein [Candidatus Bathyarchaeia archaeon]